MSFEKTMVDYVKDLLGNRFKGYRIFIFTFNVGLTGLINYYCGFISNILCEKYNVFCDQKTSEITSFFFIAFSAIVFLCRVYTDTPAGDIRHIHKRFGKGYKDEVLKLTKK